MFVVYAICGACIVSEQISLISFFSSNWMKKTTGKLKKKVQENLKFEKIGTKNVLAFRMQIYMYSRKLLHWDFRNERELTPINMTSSNCWISLPWVKYYEKHVGFTLCWTLKSLNSHMECKTSVNVSQWGFLFVHMCLHDYYVWTVFSDDWANSYAKVDSFSLKALVTIQKLKLHLFSVYLFCSLIFVQFRWIFSSNFNIFCDRPDLWTNVSSKDSYILLHHFLFVCIDVIKWIFFAIWIPSIRNHKNYRFVSAIQIWINFNQALQLSDFIQSGFHSFFPVKWRFN